MRKLIIAVLVIVALAVAADFGAAAAAEYTVAKQMRQQLRLASDPSVRINGFPFLTQAVAGHYTAIDKQASGVTADPLHDLDVEATLHDVDAPLTEVSSGDLHSVRAAKVDGLVRIKDTDLGGRRTEVVALGVIQLTGGLVRVTTSDVRLTGDGIGAVGLPRPIRQTLLSTLSTDVKTGDLPFAVTPTRIWVETGSIAVEGTAKNVSLRRAGVAVGLPRFTPGMSGHPG